jgi:hypothetical protein
MVKPSIDDGDSPAKLAPESSAFRNIESLALALKPCSIVSPSSFAGFVTTHDVIGSSYSFRPISMAGSTNFQVNAGFTFGLLHHLGLPDHAAVGVAEIAELLVLHDRDRDHGFDGVVEDQGASC